MPAGKPPETGVQGALQKTCGGFDSSPINRFGLLRYSAMGGWPGNWADSDIPRNCGAVRLIHREMENPNFVLFPANRDGILMPRVLNAV